MQGYEKVNKRRVDRRAIETLPVGDSLVSPPAKHRPKPRRRLVDFSALAAEPPGESIARENEIVARLAMQNEFDERPSQHSIAEQLIGLVDPQVIRSH